MREIIRMRAGSHVYGTNVPESDEDFKGIFIPSGDTILLQRAKENISRSTKENPLGRNQAGDQDVELFAYHQYLKLLLQGQTVALDMLFTPEEHYVTKPEPEWYSILANKKSFLSKGMKAFVGYCRSQARKYTFKIERYEATSSIVTYLKHWEGMLGGTSSLSELSDFLPILCKRAPCVEIVSINQVSGQPLRHLEVAGTKVPFSISLKNARETYELKLKGFGERVKKSQDMDGHDWKSMMHAVRVAHEAVELLSTGHITFPCPEAALLLQIRNGELPYGEVSDLIEHSLTLVEGAVEKSSLPEKPDYELADSLIVGVYRSAANSHPRSSAG